MRCNIDARGRRWRLINGLVTLIVGIVLLAAWAVPAGGWIAWAVALGAVAGGAFMIVEALTGWCALRAMGIRTPV